MTCIHLQQLYKLCEKYDLKISGSDLLHVVCRQCGVQDVCPSILVDHRQDLESASVDDVDGTPK